VTGDQTNNKFLP
jgi:hypothetical protein